MRIVGFLSKPPPVGSPLAVFFDSHSKDSRDDAQNIMALLSGDADSAKTPLMPILVDLHNLEEAQGARVGLIALSSEAGYPAILEFAKKNAVLMISTDPACVRAGICTAAVVSAPRVEVILSRRVSEISDVHFIEAFRMMVTEY
ncbi:hypothetical protein CWS72_22935 [Telmatospirillum siberiense]|uniref:NYN domain-containing protein n=1 Tax=Telmatospirillum siberiense TaxID=382514 RepID=A0A2N3PP85_9PROT|nr:hypothetical protein CWS72_22935 [Telmatospirillum siberiense]